MKIVFVMRHSGYVRNFESTLRMLGERGHAVHLVFQGQERHWLLDATDISQILCGQYPAFSHGHIPAREDGWGLVGQELRLSLDYLRYLNPEYRDAPKLRRRVERDVPDAFVRWMNRPPFSTRGGRRLVAWALGRADRAVPRSPAIDAFILEHRPDLLIVTPLIEPGSPQADYVRSARAHGVRTVFCVASWDNLTNKGLIRDPVDLVTVWNETMKQEAVTLHGVPASRVVVTGAQPFDHWFTWRPSTTREQFCQRVGLRPDVPYLLYVCSSKFVAPEEAPFVRRWVAQLRGSRSNGLREAGVLVRPHPQNANQWRHADVSGLGNVAVWPAAGAVPVDEPTRAEYFDSIFHSAGVVGVNTTAEIESAIIGRQVHTLLAPEFRETQEGTLHFHHLRNVNGGLLQIAADFPEHLAQLDATLCRPQDDAGRCRRFVEAFVRPFGLDEPATPKLVAALEELGARPQPRPTHAPVWAPIVTSFLSRWADRLEREAAVAAERRATKSPKKDPFSKVKVSKKARPPKNEDRAIEKPGISAPGGSGPWQEIASTYERLSSHDQRRFMEAISQSIPLGVFLSPRTERLDYAEAEIKMRVSSKPEAVRIRACAKEPWTVRWLEQMVHRGDVLYDIGANVGAYSLVAARKPSGAARVVAFEASYENVAALCANIVLNNLAAQITPLPVALSDANALDTFNLLQMSPGSARHRLGAGDSVEGPTVYPQPIVTYRLDDLVAQLQLPLPNHIKLDVDGGELAVLRGAARTLASPLLRSMLIEVSTELSEEITSVVEGHGLRLRSKINVKNKAGQFRVWYGLFARGDVDPLSASLSNEQTVAR